MGPDGWPYVVPPLYVWMKGDFPRLDEVTVYAIAIERMTGKETALPAVQSRWPAVDKTKSPNARP